MSCRRWAIGGRRAEGLGLRGIRQRCQPTAKEVTVRREPAGVLVCGRPVAQLGPADAPEPSDVKDVIREMEEWQGRILAWGVTMMDLI